MEEISKGTEVRARVTREMLNALQQLADARGEKLPVILREACAEYLAKRAAGSSPSSTALLELLKDQPEVARFIVGLGRMLTKGASPEASSIATAPSAALNAVLSAAAQAGATPLSPGPRPNPPPAAQTGILPSAAKSQTKPGPPGAPRRGHARKVGKS